MIMPVDEVLKQALALPEEDRLQLAEALFSSVAPPDELPFDGEWITEARRRAARIDSGEGKLSRWEDVRERARRNLGDQTIG